MTGVAHSLLACAHVPFLAPRSVIATALAPSTASASLNFFEAGFLRADTNAANTVLAPQWANQTLGNASIAAPYQIRLTVSSGNAPTSGEAVNTWLNMVGGAGGARSWGLSASGTNVFAGNWLVEIRAAINSVVLASATYDVRAAVIVP